MASSKSFGKPSSLSWRAAVIAVAALSSCTDPRSCMSTSAMAHPISIIESVPRPPTGRSHSQIASTCVCIMELRAVPLTELLLLRLTLTLCLLRPFSVTTPCMPTTDNNGSGQYAQITPCLIKSTYVAVLKSWQHLGNALEKEGT